MSNFLFPKKFLSKLTAIIRNFWWTGIREETSAKSLCLRAWKDICSPKNEGGLGIKNMQATNRAMILSAAWRIVEQPNSHISKVLQSKYFPDTSFWRANHNVPKSTFWTAILKVRPMLINNSFYQLTEGNISILYNGWSTIYVHLIIQDSHFVYPAIVRDLWLPNQKLWNTNLICNLFYHDTAAEIIRTPIIQSGGEDLLCWKLIQTGQFNSKSAYKLCLQVMQQEGEPQPSVIPDNTKALLKQIWKAKDIAPRIQTFAWRLIRKALPIGKRAGKYSKRIDKECSRCNAEEDERHIFFTYPYARAAWFAKPWYIRMDNFISNSTSIITIILNLLSSGHPHASLNNIFTFMWCLWKTILLGKSTCVVMECTSTLMTCFCLVLWCMKV